MNVRAPSVSPSRSVKEWRSPSVVALWIGGALLLWILYTFVFIETAGSGLTEAIGLGFANVLPLALLAAGVREVLKSRVMTLTVPAQVISHALLAVVFATIWYATVLVLLAFLTGVREGNFSVRGFSGPAFTWQVFQGLVMYSLTAAVCYAVRGGREAANISFVETPRPLERYLTKRGDEIHPVEVAEIVSIVGAQDYSEVATRDGHRHLVRLSLNEFERRLDPTRFVRVHRSAIINLAQLDRAEPAGGGRLTAHMRSGESVDVSRAGAQQLRSLMV
jgi:two-component system LytT family response regulator